MSNVFLGRNAVFSLNGVAVGHISEFRIEHVKKHRVPQITSGGVERRSRLCLAGDIFFWDTPGCPRCSELGGDCGDPVCDLRAQVYPGSHEEYEMLTQLRGWTHPDADHDEVCAMLGDPGIVAFVDPRELEEAVCGLP